MNKVLRIVSAILIAISVIFGVIRLIDEIDWFKYEIEKGSDYSSLFMSFIYVLIAIIWMVASVLILLYIWKSKESFRKVAYICLIIDGVLITLEELTYMFNNGYYGFYNRYIIKDIALLVACVLLVISFKKCRTAFIVAISICVVVFTVMSGLYTNTLFMYISTLVAGILLNIVSTRSVNYDNTTEALTELKRQFDQQLISEEAYKQKKLEILSKLN